MVVDPDHLVSSPGAPARGDDIEVDERTARNLTEFGNADGEMGDVFALHLPGALAPAMHFDWNAATAFLDACETSNPRVKYGFGKKISSRTAVPGVDFTSVDCSGFVREVILRYANPAGGFPDGSSQQHAFVEARGYAHATYDDGLQQDGSIRIGFLNKEDTSDDIGHVLLLRNAATMESHGGVGPDSRPWGLQPFMNKMHLFVLES